MSDYAQIMLFTAARACLKAGMKRPEATMEFMKAYDRAKETPETKRPPPIVEPAIEVKGAGLRKCGGSHGE